MQGNHRKFSLLIDDDDIVMECISWLRSQKLAKRTGRNFKWFIEELILPNGPSDSKSTIAHRKYCNWLNSLSFEVTDTENKKGSIYVDGHERSDVAAYRERFCKLWVDRYFTRMEYYKGPEMVGIPPKLAGHESKIVHVFHNESTFNAKKYQRYCRLDKDEQILKPNILRRRLMISEFL